MAKTHIIYIPGLGDQYDPIRRFALRLWWHKHVSVEFIPMSWRKSGEVYEEKVKRLEESIMRAGDATIVLIGESAGGSLAVAEAAKDGSKVATCITICGKNVGGSRVSPMLYKKNPAFRASMSAADQAVARLPLESDVRFVTFYSPFDHVVRPVDTCLPDGIMRKLLTPGHLFSIFAVLFFLWPIVLKESLK